MCAKPLGLPIAIALLPALATGCGLLVPDVCTLEAVFGVNLLLNDDAGEPVLGATLVLTEGDYQEIMTEVGPGAYAGALERAGVYNLFIAADGFEPAQLEGLSVSSGVCHVVAVSREVDLTPDGGITGIMLAGPQCPVVEPGVGDECDDQPFMGTVIVNTADGSREITRFTADENGSFQVPLAPGIYLLVPLPGANGFPFADEQSVEVTAGVFTQLEILFDTGIR